MKNKLVGIVLLIITIGSCFAQDYKIGFSPSGEAQKVVLESIQSARSTLLIACYEFTSRDIAQAVENAAHRGVKVFIVADYKASQGKYSQVRVLQSAGINVRINKNYAIMHNKFMVIDDDAIETGSFNYTAGAEKHNAENAIWEWDVKDKADIYKEEWERLWNESK